MGTIIANIVIVVLLIAITAAIVLYLVRSKKRGDACIGCPYAKQCGAKCGGNCNGQTVGNKKKEK